MSKTSKCRDCGAPVIWARNERGLKVPLDKTDQVFSIVYPGPHNEFHCKQAKQEVYVSHWITCKNRKSDAR